MKKMFLLVTMLLLLPVQFSWSSTDLGPVTISDNLRFPIFALDDTGKVATPDSIHLLVWFEGEATGDTASHVERIATAGATPDLIDSLRIGGVTYYYFDHPIADIDNSEGEGNYTGSVILWTDGQPTFNNFSFTLYDTESETLWDEIAWILDTLQNQDDWVATAAELAKVIDSLADILDSLESHDDWVAQEAGEIADILDTLQNQDDWVATAAELTKAIDSINGILDSIQIPLNVNVASVDASAIGIGDFAVAAINSDAIATNAIGHNEIAPNAISSNELAANAAEEIADAVRAEGIVCYNQSDSTFELAGLHIRATGTDDTAFIAAGDGAGHGMFLMGGLTGSGLYADAGHTIAGATGYGILARGKGDGKAGMLLHGDSGNVHGLYLLAHGTGNDMLLHGSKNIKGFIDSAKYVSVAGEGRLVDANWNEDTTGHYTPPHMGYMASQTGASGGPDSAFFSRYAGRLVDTVWNEDSTGHYTSPHMGFLASQTGATATDTTNIKTMMNNNITSAASGAGWANIFVDSVWMSNFEAHDGVAGSFGDSAQDWAATSGGTAIADTVNAILDSIQAVVGVNAIQISGDATAANNLETMLDGTGGQTFSLRGLHIRGTAGNDTALIASGYGTGMGALFAGGAGTSAGLYALGGNNGPGAFFYGGSSNGAGAIFQSRGTGVAIYLDGTARIVGYIDSVDKIPTTIDTVNYVKAGVTISTGSGAKSYTLYVGDTTGGDTTYLPGVVVSAYSMSSVLQAGMKTDTYGKVTYYTDLDSLFIEIAKDNIYAARETLYVAATGYYDTIIAYHGTIPASGSPDLCTVFLRYYEEGSPVKGATMLIRNDNIATDTTQDVIMGRYYDYARTDSLGHVSLFVPKSYLFHDSTLSLYDITLKDRRGKIVGDWPDIEIPNIDTLRITHTE